MNTADAFTISPDMLRRQIEAIVPSELRGALVAAYEAAEAEFNDVIKPEIIAKHRSEIQRLLKELEKSLQAAMLGRVGLGHNQPPEPIDDAPTIEPVIRDSLPKIIAVARHELTSTEPDRETLDECASQFKRIAAAIGLWLAKKAEVAVDEGIKFGVKAACVGGTVVVVSHHAEFQAVQDALNHAADAIMRLVHIIHP